MKKAILCFSIVILLVYQHTFILKADINTWFLNNFCISGLLATYCVAKGVVALKGMNKG